MRQGLRQMELRNWRQRTVLLGIKDFKTGFLREGDSYCGLLPADVEIIFTIEAGKHFKNKVVII